MTTTGEKLTLLAEIIRVSVKGATEKQISEELSLSPEQSVPYLRFLRTRKMIILVDDLEYFPSEKGLAYLATYDEASDLINIDEPKGYYSGSKPASPRGVYWDKTEIIARMREIIER